MTSDSVFMRLYVHIYPEVGLCVVSVSMRVCALRPQGCV